MFTWSDDPGIDLYLETSTTFQIVLLALSKCPLSIFGLFVVSTRYSKQVNSLIWHLFRQATCNVGSMNTRRKYYFISRNKKKKCSTILGLWTELVIKQK